MNLLVKSDKQVKKNKMDDGSYIINNDSHDEEVLVIKPPKRGVAVEPIIFAFFLAKTLSDAIVVNLLENRTCINNLGVDPINCTEPLRKDIEILVQPIAANFSMAKNIFEAVVPCILSLFIGPWSDVNGRRPFLLLSLAGYSCSYGIWAGLSSIPTLRPEYFLLASIPSALTGGLVAVFVTLLCIISDTSKPEDRGLRMGMLEAACLGGVTIALLLSPYLLNIANQYGFVVVFTTSAVLLLLTLIYTYFYVEESVQVPEVKNTRLFNPEYVRDIFRTCFKSRPYHGRSVILLIIFTLAINILLMDGETSIMYLSTRKRFGWDLNDYTMFASFGIAELGVVAVGGIYILTKVLNCPEMLVALVGTICRTLTAVIVALATSGWYMYVACIVSGLGGLVGPLGRSAVSKMVSNQDLGKIFALISFSEALCPLAAAPMYALVYDATLVTFPSAVFWMSTGIASLTVLAITGVVFIQWKTPVDAYSQMIEDNEPGSSHSAS